MKASEIVMVVELPATLVNVARAKIRLRRARVKASGRKGWVKTFQPAKVMITNPTVDKVIR